MQNRASRSWQRWQRERERAPFAAFVAAINEREAAMSALDDAALRAAFDELRGSARAGTPADELAAPVFSLVREAAKRSLSQRPFDVQLLAGLAMAKGHIAEVATGEGKTLAAVHPACLLALTGEGVHILTVNDYLARRDAAWMGPIYRLLGLEVGHVEGGMTPADRRRAYRCDVTYMTAKEAGFDLLRDGLVFQPDDRVQRGLHAAIVDEADSILIDEARTPLVLAGRSETGSIDASEVAHRVRALEPELHYTLDAERRNVDLTHAGVARMEAQLRLDNLYDPSNIASLADVRNALHAHALLERDVDYIVRDDRVDLVDELTGRVADDRLWPDGLQGAIEAKEGVNQQPEGRLLGTVTMQHFLRHYDRLAGMTATARTAADELAEYYGLEVVEIPTNRAPIRIDHPDCVLGTLAAKREAVIAEVIALHATGRPVLVGTANVLESESVARTLREQGVECAVLNAKNDEREAAIIADAGKLGAVTISTNMAGRGTDIRLGGADERERAAVVALGGLHVIATNRHESRRIDDQLRGRAGRQGDPGSSRSFVSLEDDLLKRFGIQRLLAFPPEHPQTRRGIASAQRIVEGQNFEIRKTLYRYSVVLDSQRRLVQSWRNAILDGDSEQRFLAHECPELHDKAKQAIGAEALDAIEDQISSRALDQCWNEHLDRLNDIRRAIQLVKLAGKPPFDAFLHQAGDAFSEFVEIAEQESIRVFETLEIGPDGVDWEGAGQCAPSSTWTYTINDDLIESNLVRDLAYNPMIVLAAPWVIPLLFVYGLWQRIRARRGDPAERRESSRAP